MKKNKRVIALILILALCLLMLAACGGNNNDNNDNNNQAAAPGGTPAGSAAPGGNSSEPPASTWVAPATETAAPPEEGAQFADHVELLLEQGIGVLNTHSLAGAGLYNGSGNQMIHAFLTWSELDGKTILPYLATSWESEDYQTWIFHLRDDAWFTNGDKLTAEDVVWSCNASKANIGTVAWESWMFVEEARAIDDYTVELKLGMVFYDFPGIMSTAGTMIYNKRAIEEDPEKGYWVGAGPYKVKEFSTNDYVIFERNDDFWGTLPYTETVTFRFVPEASSRTIMMENGTGHVAKAIPTTDYPIFQNNPDYKFITASLNNPMCIMFNLDDPVCGDWNFRMAVASALDRDNLITLAGINGTPVADDEASLWGKVTSYRNPNVDMVPFDLDKAKEYLAASKYDGTPIEFAYETTYPRLGEVLQEQLAKIGLQITLNPMDTAAFTAYSAWGDNHAQIVFYALVFAPLPIIGYNINLVEGANNNRMNFNNPEVNELVGGTFSLTDPAEMQRVYYRMQEIVAETMPAIPVYWITSAAIAVNNLGGYALGYQATEDFTHVFIDLNK